VNDSAALRITDATKVFFPKTPNEVTALDGVDLELAPGDFITVIGSNGAGKSTLQNCVAGTFPLTTGSIILDGRDLTAVPEYRRAQFIGRVFQDPRAGTAPSMSIEENVSMAILRGRRRGLRRGVTNKRRDFIREQLAQLEMGLEDRLTMEVAKLSGGQRQAMSLLMATIAEPRLLLLDEHTAALDPKVAATIMEITGRIVQEKRLTTLMVTHNMDLALRWGTRLIMMHQGRVILDVSHEEKASLRVPDLVAKFHAAAGEQLVSDRMLLE
jgi:putative ABC transport system ATP-binding protein